MSKDKKTILKKSVDTPAKESNGFIEGYASVFNIIDLVGDVVLPGAFKQTINTAIKSGKVPLMIKHFAYGGDTEEAVGIVREAFEDNYGLFIRAELFGTDDAQEVREKILAGLSMGMSIGYNVINSYEATVNNETIQYLTEIRLREITLTLTPANPEAWVTGAKSENTQEPETIHSDSKPDSHELHLMGEILMKSNIKLRSLQHESGILKTENAACVCCDGSRLRDL